MTLDRIAVRRRTGLAPATGRWRRRSGNALLALSLLMAACTPTSSRLEPYRDDPLAQASLASEAASVCSCLRGGRDLPPLPFTSDGCSASPDGRWSQCCIAHDVAYWCGGNRKDRRDADRRLTACLAHSGRTEAEAELMRIGVRIGGAPWLSLPWRWAYGWKGIHGYDRSSAPAEPVACFDWLHVPG